MGLSHCLDNDFPGTEFSSLSIFNNHSLIRVPIKCSTQPARHAFVFLAQLNLATKKFEKGNVFY